MNWKLLERQSHCAQDSELPLTEHVGQGSSSCYKKATSFKLNCNLQTTLIRRVPYEENVYDQMTVQ